MIINGATIYSEGVNVGHDCEEKIRQIMNTLKILSPSPKLSMRFLKSERQYEALVWGKANDVPIGVYNRGPSLAHVLETVCNKIKKQSVKAWKFNGSNRSRNSSTHSEVPVALAG